MTTVDPEQFRAVAGAFPSGVTVLTGVDDAGPVGLTCQSFHALSLDPPMVLFAVATTSVSWPRIHATGRVCVNVLASTQEPVARAFATSGIDKFEGLAWTPGDDGTPILDGAVAWFGCAIDAVHDGGDHRIVTATVRALGDRAGAPLIFHRGRYAALESREAT